MAKPQIGTEERVELLEYLEMLLGCVKSLHASVGVVMADVAAMRDTMLQDPDEVALCRGTRKARELTADPSIDEAMRSMDDLMEMANAQQYKN